MKQLKRYSCKFSQISEEISETRNMNLVSLSMNMLFVASEKILYQNSQPKFKKSEIFSKIIFYYFGTSKHYYTGLKGDFLTLFVSRFEPIWAPDNQP